LPCRTKREHGKTWETGNRKENRFPRPGPNESPGKLGPPGSQGPIGLKRDIGIPGDPVPWDLEAPEYER